jgi:hypothetical protein
MFAAPAQADKAGGSKMTGANPAPFMLANMEVPTAAEGVQIAHWSAIRDS